MLTMQQALTADTFHYGTCARKFGPRGGVQTFQTTLRRNGATQTWKTRPTEYRIPVKYGMYQYHQLRQHDAANVHTAADCPLNAPTLP